jgi:hypothetical protein
VPEIGSMGTSVRTFDVDDSRSAFALSMAWVVGQGLSGGEFQAVFVVGFLIHDLAVERDGHDVAEGRDEEVPGECVQGTEDEQRVTESFGESHG